MKDFLNNIFSKEPNAFDDGVYVFSSMSKDDDYWADESDVLHVDDGILEFLVGKRFSLGLEVGAGNGRATEPLCSICDNFVALESSAIGISQMKSRELKNVTNVLSFERELPFNDGVFDFVASVTVIEHIPPLDCMFFLKEHLRVLKPGGTFLIRNDTYIYRVLELIGYFDKEQPDPTHVNMVTAKKLKRLLIDVGFEIDKADYFPFYRYTKKRFPLMDLLATKGNFVCTKPGTSSR